MTAVGVTAVGVTAVRTKLKFLSIINIGSTIILWYSLFHPNHNHYPRLWQGLVCLWKCLLPNPEQLWPTLRRHHRLQVTPILLVNLFPRAECTVLGGTLGSIHSTGENQFVYGLLRPARYGIDEQLSWQQCVCSRQVWDLWSAHMAGSGERERHHLPLGGRHPLGLQ